MFSSNNGFVGRRESGAKRGTTTVSVRTEQKTSHTIGQRDYNLPSPCTNRLESLSLSSQKRSTRERGVVFGIKKITVLVVKFPH